MLRNEFKVFYDYLSQNLNSIQCMTEESAKYLTDLMSGLYGAPIILPFDRPDILILFDQRTIMIEHFRYDSSEHKNGGSLLKEELRKIDQTHIEKGLKISPIKHESSMDHLKNNILDISNKHIAKYHNYIDEVQKKKGVSFGDTYRDIIQKNKEFGFATQDDSLDYNMFKKADGSMEYITPFHLKEFRDFLRQHHEIEHLFHMVKSPAEKKFIYYFHNVPKELTILEEIMNSASPSKIKEADVFYWKNNK